MSPSHLGHQCESRAGYPRHLAPAHFGSAPWVEDRALPFRPPKPFAQPAPNEGASCCKERLHRDSLNQANHDLTDLAWQESIDPSTVIPTDCVSPAMPTRAMSLKGAGFTANGVTSPEGIQLRRLARW